MNILVTGGAGFIGSALVRYLVRHTEHRVLVLDKLTYAGNPEALREAEGHPRYRFERLDLAGDAGALARLFDAFRPDAVIHLAAETHVDRSIDDPSPFVESNVVGTFRLLEAARRYRRALPPERADAFRLLHVSTDEVYGSLGAEGRFDEASRYDPRSPYSASKAGADHLARAWFHTYGLPVLVTNCSNNFGPFQYPEKLVPVVILRALAGEEVPVYGSGENVRDWLYVDDHVRALLLVLERGAPGETYLVGADSERTSLEMATAVCALVDRLAPEPGLDRRDLIAFVADRPGHDLRYAVDASKLRALGWSPRESFASGLEATVRWYLEHLDWCRATLREGLPERLGLTRGA